MAIDTTVPQSPGWWLRRLSRELHNRRHSPTWTATALSRRDLRPGIDLLNDYLRGDPPLPKVSEGWHQAMRHFLRMSRMNYALLSVQAVQQRMNPLGFRTSADSDRDGDQRAARIFTANDLALRFDDVAEWMLGLGDGYMMVGEPEADGGPAMVTAENPREVITAEDPVTGRTVAGLKVIRDEWTGGSAVMVFLPGRTHVARAKALGGFAATGLTGRWDWDESAGGESGSSLPSLLANDVPIVRFQNARGVSEFEPHLDVLDRINDQILSRVTIAKIQAFRQRAAKNLPDKDDEGNEIDYSTAFLAEPGSMWRLPAEADIWESQTVDLGPIRMAVKDDVEAFAAVTMTPLHYITPDAAQGSAEGASVMREAHLFRTENRMRRCDRRLADVLSLAFKFEGDAQRADRLSIETIWGPTERHSLTEMMSAATQARSAGLPQSSVFTDVMGYRPTDLPRLESERARDLLFSDAPAAGG